MKFHREVKDVDAGLFFRRLSLPRDLQ
jgi:hypothetical protein